MTLQATASGPLRGRIKVPGDKSISHRALILGGLAEGETRIEGLLEGDDVLATAAAVRALGAEVERTGEGAWRVRGGPWTSPEAPIDCGNSGTGARLLMGAVAGRPITATFTGDESLRSRPMKRVTGPLGEMGTRFEGGDRLPITVHGGGLGGIDFENATASAQVKSAILLAGLGSAADVIVREPRPSRDHSENMLAAFGCELTRDGGTVRLGAQRGLRGTDVVVPADPSSAAFPLVAGLIVRGSEVTVEGMLVNPLRAGLYETLIEMGADLRIENRRAVNGEAVADLTARASRLYGVTVPADRAPSMIDEYPILAVAAAFAEGETVMHGLGELRVKESDRLAAILAGLAACGVDARADGDTLVVTGGAPAGGGLVTTHGDHRIAMSFLMLGLAARDAATVDEPHMIATSFPGFVPLMQGLGARIA
ncbi:3-phosphoshikimate 1-carboxyvinyltransferase [Sphingosinicella sp. LHD-64]|uniref:3-phosphoshikimate 1-carboxyvinyltransferase n=1 Tax=Sphingosinicella sp. LHD-64 TaxID=3072139 RepID=UPI00280EF1CB|nr:3-phosphoshikimate 1-carboxyvinyltransferase [Sphingosinicella sp. LHD-64]MDQ8755570.1 3-phosphoshikimate 1-carboxyvinyltransferase [Sphingosinicella sp. LHD-64]